MRFIAVDDERLQLETIIEYLTEFYPDDEVKGFTRVRDVLEHIETNTVDVAILDINMPGNINGINLGEMLRKKNKRTKILYCTGYSEYAMEAYKMHANGYLQKPIMKEDLQKELSYVMQMPVYGADKKPYIHTFGNFDIYYGNRPVAFKRNKSKEVLAYLTDREGGWVSNKELMAVMWENAESDAVVSKYIPIVIREMELDLEAAGISHIIERKRGKLRLLCDEVVCDYFDYLQGEEAAVTAFHDEYMSQYSWGEKTLASLLSSKPSD